jgi:transposase
VRFSLGAISQAQGVVARALQALVHQALERGTRAGCRRTAQTCANLLAREVSRWTFTRHAGVEPTNNAAEQVLRTVVLKRKISGPMRSTRGQHFVARGFSVMESCRRQGRDLRAWLGAGPVPSLLPGG